MSKKRIFTLAITLLVIGFAAMPVSAQTAAGLVLPKGEAWISVKGNLSSGYIFQEDGTCLSINNYDGEKVGGWTVVAILNWTVRGNSLAMENPESLSVRSYDFTLSGNTLTLSFFGSPETYTKTSGINPSTPRYQ